MHYKVPKKKPCSPIVQKTLKGPLLLFCSAAGPWRIQRGGANAGFIPGFEMPQ